MCANCNERQKKMAEMEHIYLGNANGARRINEMIMAVNDHGQLVIAQELDVATIDENGVSKETKTAVVYLDPEVLAQVIMGMENDDGA